MDVYGEFRSHLYRNVFFDYKLQKRMNSFYSVDTGIVLRGIGLEQPINNISRVDIEHWFNSARITLYQPNLEELIGILKNDRMYLEEMRKLLNKPNVRFLITDTLDVRNWQKTLRTLNSDLYSNLLKEDGVGGVDKTLIGATDYERGEVISLDGKINEIAYRYGVLLSDMLIEKKLPYEFIGHWVTGRVYPLRHILSEDLPKEQQLTI